MFKKSLPLQNLEHVCLPLWFATVFAIGLPLPAGLVALLGSLGQPLGRPEAATKPIASLRAAPVGPRCGAQGAPGPASGRHEAYSEPPGSSHEPQVRRPGRVGAPKEPLQSAPCAHAGPWQRPSFSPEAMAKAVANQWRTQWQTTVANTRVRGFAVANCF